MSGQSNINTLNKSKKLLDSNESLKLMSTDSQSLALKVDHSKDCEKDIQKPLKELDKTSFLIKPQKIISTNSLIPECDVKPRESAPLSEISEKNMKSNPRPSFPNKTTFRQLQRRVTITSILNRQQTEISCINSELKNAYFTDLLPYSTRTDLLGTNVQRGNNNFESFRNFLNPHNTRITESFLRHIFDMVLDYVWFENDRTSLIIEFKKPEEMLRLIDFNISDPLLDEVEWALNNMTTDDLKRDTLKRQEKCDQCNTNNNIDNDPKDLKIDKDNMDDPNMYYKDLNEILFLARQVLRYQVKTGHPRFFNQLSTGLDIISLAGEILTAVTNSNMFTYEISPVYVLMEQFLIYKMCDIVGFLHADGIFCPGGTISNLYAILCARYWTQPNSKQKGNYAFDRRLIVFTSEHSHYSIKGAAAVSGIGTDNVVTVKCDSNGRMLVSDLEYHIIHQLKTGNRPFLVNATSGTTVYGAFDSLEPIGTVCRKYGIWFHVDASWGGGALLSNKHKHLLQGIDQADSITWNPHKLMGVLLQCSVFLIRHKGLLYECNQMSADYLFQRDKPYDVNYDTGDKSIQCGRHVDVFKLWLMWKAKGMIGFELQMDYLWDMTKYFTDVIRNREGYILLVEPECTNVCFWYLPPSIRNMADNQERNILLERVAPIIKRKMMEQGTLMIGYQPLLDKVNFFRLIISNPAVTKDDLNFVVEEIERLGADIIF